MDDKAPEDREVFTCARCGGVFVNSWSDEEAEAERIANGIGEDYAEVCDGCYGEWLERQRAGVKS